MACCAFGPCGRRDQLSGGPGLRRNPQTGRFDCWLCYGLARECSPIEACARETTTGPCVLIRNHPRWLACRGEKRAEKIDTSTRDGDPKLTAERKRGNLAFRKRQRAGALWVPPDRRV